MWTTDANITSYNSGSKNNGAFMQNSVTGQGSRWGHRDPNNQFIMRADFSVKNSSISQKQIILQISTVPLTAN